MRAILATSLALLLLPVLAAAPAQAHMVGCSVTDAVCVADCLAGHDGIGGHSCTLYWPLAATSGYTCRGDPSLVQWCWTGTDPGCFHFVVLGDRSPLLDFCY